MVAKLLGANFLYNVSIDVKPGTLYDFHHTTDELVAAHKGSSKGLQFALYATYAGAGPRYEIFVPLDKLGDLDDMSENHEVMADHYGPAAGRSKLQAWGEAASAFTTKIYTRKPEQSNLHAKDENGMPNIIYRMRIRTAPGKLYTLDDTTKQLVEAHRKSKHGVSFSLFAVYAGGGSDFDLFVPRDSLAKLDSMAENHAVAEDVLGEGPGRALLSAWGNAITSFEVDLLQLQPTQSI